MLLCNSSTHLIYFSFDLWFGMLYSRPTFYLAIYYREAVGGFFFFVFCIHLLFCFCGFISCPLLVIFFFGCLCLVLLV